MTKKSGAHDVIIIGGGPAGCNAAIVLARCRRRVLLIDEGKQRNLASQGMHNFLTRDGILPAEYLTIAKAEMGSYGVQLINDTAVTVRRLGIHGFEVKDKAGHTHLGRRLLLATGVTDNIPDIPGMRELWGCSVHHCPHCDGWESRDKVIGLYARDVNGYGMAMALRELSDRVILFTDGSRYLRPKQKMILKSRGIATNNNRIHSLSYKEKQLTHIVLENGENIACETLFTDHGHKINDTLLRQLGCNCTRQGAAITNRRQQTNIPGLYVAGDASFDMHFVIVAAAEGAKAGVAINNDLLKTDNEM